MGVVLSNKLFLFVQHDKKSMEESTSFKETFSSTNFADESTRIVRSELKLDSKPTAVHIDQSVFQFESYALL